ncbi:MAG TPA: contractile injection system protein, VgrG/Pvc8 family, partial [Planctomycetota bacterium]|nr:contractile injection system protein, VgrG/Pvc8 family [Planctomycetota bacterium]
MAIDLAAPAYKVYVDGTECPSSVYVDMIAVEVRDCLDGADMVTITLANKNCKYSSGDFFSEGKVIKISMGYRDHIEKLAEVELVSIEPVFPLKGTDTVVIRGYDRLHRLRYGKKRRGWTEKKYSEVLDDVAKDLGVTFDYGGKPPAQKFDWVFQNNETDIDFVKRIAREIGYEIDLDDQDPKKVVITPSQEDKGQVKTLTWGFEIKSFAPRMSTADQVTEVIVRGWDPKQVQAIIGKASVSDITKKMKGLGTGPETVQKAYEKAVTKIVTNPVWSVQEAQDIAKAELHARAMQFLTGEGTSVGATELRAGKVIELKGLGETFSGLYYVTEATHTFVPGAGYATLFKVARPSWGMKQPNQPPQPTPPPPQPTPPEATPPAPTPPKPTPPQPTPPQPTP